MKTIHNRTQRPLKISLRGGKVLHLGPDKSGQVADPDLERPALKRRIEAGEIDVLDDEHATGGAGGGAHGQVSTHGHPPATGFRRKGDR